MTDLEELARNAARIVALDALNDDLRAVLGRFSTLERLVANINAGTADDRRWVVTDNVRRVPDAIAQAHLELGRLLAAAAALEAALPIGA